MNPFFFGIYINDRIMKSSKHSGSFKLSTTFFFLILLFFSRRVEAQTYVSPSGIDAISCGTSTSPCQTLQYAIDKTTSPGSILVLPGSYSGAGNVGINFPGKYINITSTGGPDLTFLDALGSNRQFLLNGLEDGWVVGFTIQNGRATSGGCGIYLQSSLSFKNCIFQNCVARTVSGSISVGTGIFAQGGGALYIINSNPTFLNVQFKNNVGFQAAGSVFLGNGGNATFRDCAFTGETAVSFGGSVVPEGKSDSRFYNCTWRNCFSNFGGAVDTGSTSTTEFHDCLFEDCSAQIGGGIYHYNNDRVKVVNTVFRRCSTTTNGGAVVVSIQCSPTYVNCTFQNNSAPGVGGAFYAESSTSPFIYNSTFIENTASGGGGGLYGRASVNAYAENCLFQNNSALYGGAILFEDYSTVSLQKINCSGNSVQLDGGCLKVSNQVSATIQNSNLEYNTAKTEGGGIQTGQNSKLVIKNCTIQKNWAQKYAGGAFHSGSSSASYLNSTFDSNKCDSSGGAISLSTSSTIVANRTIFTKNVARQGGAFFSSSSNGFLVLGGSIFSNNTAQFGGAAFFDAAARKNVINDTLMLGNIAEAGGTFFYDVWDRLLTYNNVSFIENQAKYGVIEATKPWQMIPMPFKTTEFSPKDIFSVKLRLVDFFNNTAVSTVNQVIVNLIGLRGLSVQTIFYSQPFSNGVVTFNNIAVTGYLNSTYYLSLNSTGLPSIVFPITIVSCGPGYAKTSGPNSFYTCAICPSGEYSLVPDASCSLCPPGGDCALGGANITAQEGWWLDPDSLISNNPKLYSCQPGYCIGKSNCGANREGRLCSRCETGFSEWNQQCQDCRTSTSPEWMLLPYIFGLLYSGLLIKFPKLTEAGIPKSLAFLVQCSLILFHSDNRSTSQSIVNFLNFAFDWLVVLDYRNKCILDLSPLKRLAYNYYEPLSPLIAMLTWYLAFRMYYLIFHRKKIPSIWKWRLVGSLIWVLLWCYILLAKASFSLINCTTIGNVYVLSAAPTIVCGSPEHIPFMIGAWFVIVFYIIGFPILCAGLLWYAKKKIITNPGYPLCKELYRTYQPAYWFYEIILLFRKLLLTLLDVFLIRYDVEHDLVLCIFFYVIFFTQYWTQPFKNRMFNLAEDFVLMTLSLISGLSLAGRMRINYQSTVDVNIVGLGFVAICFFVVLCLMFFLSRTGNYLMHKLVAMSPFLAKVVHSLRKRSEKVHQWGSAFSMEEKRNHESVHYLDGIKPEPSKQLSKNLGSCQLKKSNGSEVVRSFPAIDEEIDTKASTKETQVE